MKANCITRSLWHWSKYGGTIIYDHNHAKVIGSSREFVDDTIEVKAMDLLEWGIVFIKKSHAEFLNDEELLILESYFSTFDKF